MSVGNLLSVMHGHWGTFPRSMCPCVMNVFMTHSQEDWLSQAGTAAFPAPFCPPQSVLISRMDTRPAGLAWPSSECLCPSRDRDYISFYGARGEDHILMLESSMSYKAQLFISLSEKCALDAVLHRNQKWTAARCEGLGSCWHRTRVWWCLWQAMRGGLVRRSREVIRNLGVSVGRWVEIKVGRKPRRVPGTHSTSSRSIVTEMRQAWTSWQGSQGSEDVTQDPDQRHRPSFHRGEDLTPKQSCYHQTRS